MLIESSIKITPVAQSRIHEIDMNNLPFGKIFSDHMMVANYKDGKWEQPQIVPYGKMQMMPSLSALNYGQSIFEGMKAFKTVTGDTVLFRPYDNYKRMNRSAYRLSMPEIPEHIFMDGLTELIRLDRQWVPSPSQGSLYIRPLYFATEECIGVKASDSYTFVIFTCPVGPFYKDPVNLLATKEFIRAAVGGTGAAKAAGNYAGSLMPDKLAKQRGYHNVMWLDASEHQFIEECGTMNIFFVIGDTIITPQLTGTILAGITRDSVIRLLKDNNYKVENRRITIYEIEEAYFSGNLTEVFGTGTAANIAPIGKIGFGGKDMILPPVSERKITNWLSQTLDDIKNGLANDPYHWTVRV